MADTQLIEKRRDAQIEQIETLNATTTLAKNSETLLRDSGIFTDHLEITTTTMQAVGGLHDAFEALVDAADMGAFLLLSLTLCIEQKRTGNASTQRASKELRKSFDLSTHFACTFWSELRGRIKRASPKHAHRSDALGFNEHTSPFLVRV
jgi:hypothetical protein